MADVIILGNGPAGISAALYTVRAGLETMVIGRDGGSLEKTDKIENYYGFAEPVSSRDLVQNGINQAKRLGVSLLKDEVVGMNYNGRFVIQTKQTEYEADCVILATGSSRKSPAIEGLQAFEGKGVSYCAVCDGFFYRGKPVAVLGDGEYALHEASELLPIAKSVTLLTNGKKPNVKIPSELSVNDQEIAELEGEELLQSVRFKDGSSLPVSGVFVAVGVAGSTDLAKKLGAQVNGTAIAVNGDMQTNLPGFFAAGDCTGGLLQIAKAVYEGAKAGTSAIRFLREKKK
ncbi:MAG: FAD-dependent oxidoreductase [Clostridiales bacterium]|nr:FAD-dependent oxidoreductase [Clostridiales bacterium]